MNVLPANMSVYHGCVWCLFRSEESIASHGTVITESCETLCGYWEKNPAPGLWEEQKNVL